MPCLKATYIFLQRMKKIFLVIIFSIILNACVSRLEKHGYMFDLSDYEMLREGVTGKEKVLRIMGSPTLVSDLGGSEAWIYCSEKVNHFLFFRPDILERNLLVIKFDESDIVRELKRIDLGDENQRFNFVSNYTSVNGHQMGFFKSIFSNVGQIKPQ